MKKKLIIALCVVALLLAAAVGAVIYLENRGSEEEPSAVGEPQVTTDATDETPEATEETIIISLPTENTEDVLPEETFGEEDLIPPVTGAPQEPGATEDPDSNETPEDIF